MSFIVYSTNSLWWVNNVHYLELVVLSNNIKMYAFTVIIIPLTMTLLMDTMINLCKKKKKSHVYLLSEQYIKAHLHGNGKQTAWISSICISLVHPAEFFRIGSICLPISTAKHRFTSTRAPVSLVRNQLL